MVRLRAYCAFYDADEGCLDFFLSSVVFSQFSKVGLLMSEHWGYCCLVNYMYLKYACVKRKYFSDDERKGATTNISCTCSCWRWCTGSCSCQTTQEKGEVLICKFFFVGNSRLRTNLGYLLFLHNNEHTLWSLIRTAFARQFKWWTTLYVFIEN